MSKIVFDIPDDKIQLVMDAFADTQGYQEFTGQDKDGNPIVNPDSKQIFAKKCIGAYIQSIVRMYQRKLNEAAFLPMEVIIS